MPIQVICCECIALCSAVQFLTVANAKPYWFAASEKFVRLKTNCDVAERDLMSMLDISLTLPSPWLDRNNPFRLPGPRKAAAPSWQNRPDELHQLQTCSGLTESLPLKYVLVFLVLIIAPLLISTTNMF